MTQPVDTRNRATSTQPERSSRRTAHKSPLGWLPWALLALLALIAAVVFLVINAIDDDGPSGPAGDTLGQASDGSGANGDDGSASGAAAPTSAATRPPTPTSGSTAGAAAAAQPGAGAAGLLAGQQDLLSASGGSLTAQAGVPVTGTAPVESVVSDEGFWVGRSASQRVFVFLTTQARRSSGESGFQVRAGQTVALTGSVVTVEEAPESVSGVTGEEGRAQLSRQGAFVSADTVELAS